MRKNHISDKKLSAFSLVELSIVLLIIGILIAGITSASRLIAEYRLTTARTISQSSAVPSIADLALWLDATAEEKVTNAAGSTDIVDTETVNTWIDNSPQTVTPLTFTSLSGSLPSYVRSGVNNLPTLRFTSVAAATSGDCMSADFSAGVNTGQFTLFTVVRPTLNQSATRVIIRSLASTIGYSLDVDTDETFNFSAAADTDNDTVAATLGNVYVVAARRDDTSNTIYLDGTASAATTAAYTAGTSAATFIGCSAASTAHFDGDISEIILYSRSLRAAEIDAVEEYLGKKYNITMN